MDVNLGHEPTSEHQRDAIHVAVVPVVASARLYPGQRVAVTGKGEAGPGPDHVGIVDPFLETVVEERVRFWLYLFPNSISGMRHHWQHPKFDEHEPQVANNAKPTK